jgi:tripartite-type tricarboxylate transporter receptor subunit TctC
MRRRDFVKLVGTAALSWPMSARAQFNASRPITMIVPFPPGGGADVLVRILTKYMSDILSRTIVVENQPGAGGALAFAHVARAAPDGYTLGWSSAGFAVMAATLPDLSFSPTKDFVHVCDVAENPFVLVVNPELSIRSVKDLIDYAKARPNELNFAHNGAATLTNLVVELLKIQAGIEVTQVAYRGDNYSVSDVIAGHVQAMFSNSPVALPHVAAGHLRALAVTSAKRSSAAPDIPTMVESGYPDFKVVVWQGITGPAGMDLDVINRINASACEALKVPEVIERFSALGAERVGSTPEQFAALVSRELDIWSDVVRRSGVKPN